TALWMLTVSIVVYGQEPTGQVVATAAGTSLTDEESQFVKHLADAPENVKLVFSVLKKIASMNDQQLTVERWAEDPQAAKAVVGSIQTLIALDNAAAAKDVKVVLSGFNPEFNQALIEYIYQTHKQAFVRWFIAEGGTKQTVAPQPRPPVPTEPRQPT